MVVCAVVCALLWPRARDAALILAAQDDPAGFADARLNSALRTEPAVVTENIEAALGADDADLADSLVELARDKDIPLNEELSRRVSNAVAEANSSAHFAKRFAAGLVTGNADDVASLSGTVAGDLLVFGDIRDMVREGKHLAMGEDTDRLVLGLAAAGLVVTAATYVSLGEVAPARAGLTPGTALEVTADDTGVRIERVAPGPKLVRIGKRLVAKPTVAAGGIFAGGMRIYHVTRLNPRRLLVGSVARTLPAESSTSSFMSPKMCRFCR